MNPLFAGLFHQDQREWLEVDGLGGFASGTVSGIRTRRYHALLLHATRPPTGRLVLVNGSEVWVTTPAGTVSLSSHRYAPDVVHPDGAQRIDSFKADPWPRWVFRLTDGTRVAQELVVQHGAPRVVMRWELLEPVAGVSLSVRPLFSGRDYHALHKENPAFIFDAQVRGERITWRPYQGVPAVVACSNGTYTHEPEWYRNFLYTEERDRGLDCTEDLASPGTFRWDLSQGDAVWILSAEGACSDEPWQNAGASAKRVRARELQRRRSFPSLPLRSADAYLVRRGAGRTIIAGYPWFTDWGRDTLIALRGLCLATGRLDDAREILLEWAGTVSQGMLPNRFPDHGDTPEFNSVDAALWYIIAVHDWERAMAAQDRAILRRDRTTFRRAVEAIVSGYAQGTRFGIRLDPDGLLAAGEPGVALTWMDAKVGEWVVTPRIGKPVEIEALWLNALSIAGAFSKRWKEAYERGSESFRAKFWNAPGGCLYDVVDVGHRPGAVDPAFRPNQVLAIGGLPVALVNEDQARRALDAVERRLWTPMGLRSLAPGSPGYAPQYVGGVRERDGAYHQGTVWPWLIGPFVEAWVRIRGGTAAAKREARRRFVAPLLRHVETFGMGHVCEIADAEAPHAPRGCPFQAWSLGELLRLLFVVLAP